MRLFSDQTRLEEVSFVEVGHAHTTILIVILLDRHILKDKVESGRDSTLHCLQSRVFVRGFGYRGHLVAHGSVHLTQCEIDLSCELFSSVIFDPGLQVVNDSWLQDVTEGKLA